MARRQYPSDDLRKRQKPHVKVHLSIANHPSYGRVFADSLLRGVIVGIWVVAARAHVSATNDWVTLINSDVLWITGKDRMVDAAKLLRRACEALSYPVRHACDRHANHSPSSREADVNPSPSVREADVNPSPSVREADVNVSRDRCHRPAKWVIQIRNFSRKQGFTPQTPAETPRSSAASEEPKNQRTDIPHSATPPLPEIPAADAAFERVWQLYPKRAGGNSKKNALAKWKARIRNGVASDELTAGTVRYAAYVRATGKEGTEYVMQTETFFGSGDHWREEWKPPTNSNGQQHGGFVG